MQSNQGAKSSHNCEAIESVQISQISVFNQRSIKKQSACKQKTNKMYKHSDTTQKIINCFYTVYNTLGFGFLEKVYENSLCSELKRIGLNVKPQYPISVFFKDELVGEYFADILVDNSVIIELKACETLNQSHENQLVNYLKATEIEVGLLLNFGKKPEIKRKIYTNR